MYDKLTWDAPHIPMAVVFNNLAGEYSHTLYASLNSLGDRVKLSICKHFGLSFAWTIDIVLPNGKLLNDNDVLAKELFGKVPYFFAVPKGICETPQAAIDVYEFNPVICECRLE